VIFKPLVISTPADLAAVYPSEALSGDQELARRTGQSPSPFLKGIWVDGGLFNNAPLRIFDEEPGPNPKTLLLRLKPEEPPTAYELRDFLRAYAHLLLGTGESQVSRTTGGYASCIVLDPGPIDLLDFNPGPVELGQGLAAAWGAVMRYFEVTGTAVAF
jgi:hypothetical protein